MGMQIRSLLMASVVLSIVSCGGGSDEGPPPPQTPAISKARLIERADPMCRRDQEQLVAKLKTVARPTREARRTIAVTAPVFEINAETILSGARKIEALGTPSTDADLLGEYLDERTTAGNALRSAARAARAEDFPALQAALTQYGRSRAQALGIRFGFKACGLGATKASLQRPAS